MKLILRIWTKNWISTLKIVQQCVTTLRRTIKWIETLPVFNCGGAKDVVKGWKIPKE